MLALCHVPSRSPLLSLSLSLLTPRLFHPLIASLSLTRLSYSGNPVAPPVFYFSSIHVSPTSGLFFFLFPSVPLVSTTLSLSPLFPFFRPFLSPECSSPFAPIPRSLSLSWDNPSLLSLFYFHFPFASNPSLFFHSFFSLSLSLSIPLSSLRLSTSYLFLSLLSLAFPTPSSPSLVFSFSSFLFRVAVNRRLASSAANQREKEREASSSSLSLSPVHSLSRVCGTRETIMGRTGWPCPPQNIGCRGEIGNREYTRLSVLLVSSFFHPSPPSLSLHLFFCFFCLCSSRSARCSTHLSLSSHRVC